MRRTMVIVLFVAVLCGALPLVVAAEPSENTPRPEALPQSSSSDQFVPEGNWSGTDWQARGPAETGAIPETRSEEPWMKEYGAD